ncbi:hypothetical protein OB905_02695 [Halobacteria archaeon AArc-dxtr1]|nr:hypothetical protein [Halobacteria archaeon AArc-dxtr1]
MNRRSLLAASSAGAVLGVSGCLADLESLSGSSGDEGVPGCTHRSEWNDDITTGSADPDPDSVAGRRDCANAERPEPTGEICTTVELESEDGEINEFHSTGIEPYPDPPTAFDEQSLIEYVYEYERAYSNNWAVSRYESPRRAVMISFGIHENDTRVLDHDEITAIKIEFGFGVESRNQDGEGGIASDHLGEVSVYGIDETGIVRSDAEYTFDEDENGESTFDETLDPVEDGDLLQCF